jgi:hypothetical protein
MAVLKRITSLAGIHRRVYRGCVREDGGAMMTEATSLPFSSLKRTITRSPILKSASFFGIDLLPNLVSGPMAKNLSPLLLFTVTLLAAMLAISPEH